jgi:hypothetical protein
MKEMDRSRYVQEAESKFDEMSAKLTGINVKVEQMIASDVLPIIAPVSKLLNQAETQLATVKERLAKLKCTDDASWQSDKQDLEAGWEGLLRSIKSLVTRVH